MTVLMRMKLALRSAAVVAVLAGARAPANAADAADGVAVETRAAVDTVTVGQRVQVEYAVSFPDTLRPLRPVAIASTTVRAVHASWTDAPPAGGRIRSDGRVTFLALALDTVSVPSFAIEFLSPAGDTVRAFTDEIPLTIRLLAAEATDVRPLKEQWTVAPNYLLWTAVVMAVLALAAAVVWWVRRRRARRPADAVPEVRLPPEHVALTELERIAAMGLVVRGEFKTHYTLVTDTVRRYLAARYHVDALDRTTHELLDDLARHGERIDGLAALLEEADLVKFAKFTPDAPAAHATLERARGIVVATTPHVAPAVAEGTAA